MRVVGAGTMGCGIAAGFIANGCEVVLLVRDASRGEAVQRQTLALLGSPATAPQREAFTVTWTPQAARADCEQRLAGALRLLQ